MKDGTTYTGGRSTFCLKSFEYRKAGTETWIPMFPTPIPGPPSGHMWTEKNVKDTEGLGPSMSIANRVLGMTVYETKVRELDPDTIYRVSVNVGSMDFIAMRSSGADGAFNQSPSSSGAGTILTVDARPGATSVVIPAQDTCQGEVRATKSTTNTYSVSLFDRKSFPALEAYEGVVLESDAYPSANSYFPVFDSRTGGFSIKVCAPHFKADGSLNVGYYRLLLTGPMLRRMGYYFRLADGQTVQDGRTLTADQLKDLQTRVGPDFSLTSNEQGTVQSSVTLSVDPSDGEISLRISGDVHYSGPTISVLRTGSGVWPTDGISASGRYLTVGYRNGEKVAGTLYVELIAQASRKTVAKSSVKAKPLGAASVLVPKKTGSGQYVLRVYIAGAKVKGKSKITKIQDLPVSVTKGG